MCQVNSAGKDPFLPVQHLFGSAGAVRRLWTVSLICLNWSSMSADNGQVVHPTRGGYFHPGPSSTNSPRHTYPTAWWGWVRRVAAITEGTAPSVAAPLVSVLAKRTQASGISMPQPEGSIRKDLSFDEQLLEARPRPRLPDRHASWLTLLDLSPPRGSQVVVEGVIPPMQENGPKEMYCASIQVPICRVAAAPSADRTRTLVSTPRGLCQNPS